MAAYHLFFDLDGTLTDPAPGIVACIRYAVERLAGPPLPEADLRQYIGPPLRDSFAEILGTRDSAVVEEAVRQYRERFSSVGLYENRVYPGIPQALAELSDAGFSMSVVTSKPHVYANRIIEHFGLRAFFARVHGAELSGVRSAKTELVSRALADEGAEPGRACMIGDRQLDVIGGRAHGLRTVGVAWGYGTVDELRDAGADRVVAMVDELVPACVEGRATDPKEPEALLAEQTPKGN